MMSGAMKGGALKGGGFDTGSKDAPCRQVWMLEEECP